MNLEQAIGVLQATVEELEEQLGQPRDLFHFHLGMAARSTYQAALQLLDPVRDMVGPEVRLQRVYLGGIATACENVAQLLRQVGEE